MIKLLSFSTLYPNANNPKHGVFVEHRLRKLVATGQATTVVVAPVPWTPPGITLRSRYGRYSSLPRREFRYGIEVLHPRYPVVPRIGMLVSPLLLTLAMQHSLRRGLLDPASFDVIDAHYFYPDGVTAVKLGARLAKPVVITARGTDVNLLPQYATARRRILWAADRAAAIVTVSEALRQRLIELGVDGQKVITLRNGVDLTLFRPLDRAALRDELGFRRPTLLSVGHLDERKGHHLVVEAMRELPELDLVIVGDGPMHDTLRELVARTGTANRVRFAGVVAQQDLVRYYNAADALVLASSREGMANVLLESIACGTPVVATAIWGTPEVIARPCAGVLIEQRSAPAIVHGVRELMARYPDRADTREYALQFSWDATTAGQVELFAAVRNGRIPVADRT
jgi:glycosyltransferase involved in cell wall biosynthesis